MNHPRTLLIDAFRTDWLRLVAGVAILGLVAGCGTEEETITDGDEDASTDTGGADGTADVDGPDTTTDTGPSACTTPDPRGCAATGCADGLVCLPDLEADGCRPSSCGCDEETGTWVCTEDCGTPVSCQEDPAAECPGSDPRSCWQTGCPVDTECTPTGDPGCASSSCFCDAETGSWGCTDDCRPVAECQPVLPDPSRCTGPNPAGCSVLGCTDGQECLPTGAEGCQASACSCDAASGEWTCTADCGPVTACQTPPNPGACPDTAPSPGAACDESAGPLDCSWGEECCCGGCFPSFQCSCEGGTWLCLNTDACFRPTCDGSACTSNSDCSLGGSDSAVCVEGICRDAAYCDWATTFESCASRGDDCAWQDPGCGEPSNPIESGCYPSRECETAEDCPSGWQCQPDADVLPECARPDAEGIACDACGQTRSLCVRPG
jgi:hypothetical protein